VRGAFTLQQEQITAQQQQISELRKTTETLVREWQTYLRTIHPPRNRRGNPFQRASRLTAGRLASQPPLRSPRQQILKASLDSADWRIMFEWSDSYSVGVRGIDSQHKNLFRLAGELQRAIVAGETKVNLFQFLDRLVRYTVVHFAYEERLLEEAGYPDLQTHREEHGELRARALEFQRDIKEGRYPVAFELLQFLKSLLRHHVLESDGKYAPYLRRNSTDQTAGRENLRP
jgi:hemerythrin